MQLAKHLKIYILVLATLASANLYARLQGQGKVDSLLKELSNTKEDTGKVNLLNILSHSYMHLNPDTGIAYGQLAEQLAVRLSYKKGQAWANIYIGDNYYSKLTKMYDNPTYSNDRSGFTKILDHYATAEKLFREMNDKEGMLRATSSIAVMYMYYEENEKALEYEFKVLKLHTDMGTGRGLWGTLSNIGNNYRNLGQYSSALKYYYRAIDAAREVNEENRVIGFLRNIGDVYADSGNYALARECYYKSLQMLEAVKDTNSKNMFAAVVLMNISDTYTRQKEYLMAIRFAQLAMRAKASADQGENAGFELLAIGKSYLSLYHMPANELAVLLKTDTSGVHVPKDKRALMAAAVSFLEKGLDSYRRIGQRHGIKSCHEHLYMAYKQLGNSRRSLEHYEAFIAARDTIAALDNEKERMKQLLQYEFGKKEAMTKVEQEKRDAVADKMLGKERSIRYASIGVAIFMLLIAGIAFTAYRQKQKDNAMISSEKQRSERLLLNILPEEIAAELKLNGHSEAKYFDEVTVLFTDFVSFTQASERMMPQELVNELDVCFKAFDAIIDSYSIEKIKTIGDAYMAVSGLPKANPHHAADIVRAALEMADFMEKRYNEIGDKTFRVRIGVHSGSVVAGIVGVKKFAYDIWGDTVNTASRMESSGSVGKVNISETTYELVKDKFTCEYRGEVEAKGKGVMKMYFVNA